MSAPPVGDAVMSETPVRAIVAQNLTSRFGEVVALNDVSFEIEAGEVVALLGPNGAGKTTLLEILEGYLEPSAGTVSVLAANPRRAPREWRARIGVVLQSTSLDLELTVGDALRVFGSLFGHPRPVSEVLELIGLEAEANARIGQLSGGQRRRVDLGVGIIGRPELLFLDEPTTGLDPAARRNTWAIIRQLTQAGTTVLLSTHYMEEAQQLAGRLVVLAEGRIVADSTPDELRASAARSTVRVPLVPGPPRSRLPRRFAAALAPERASSDEFAFHMNANSSSSGLELLVDSADLTEVLGQLLEWAQDNRIDLSGLQVAPPSLEDTYLELTARAS